MAEDGGDEGEEGEAEMSESDEEESSVEVGADGKAVGEKKNASPKLARQESLMRL
jgi:hypothetical protein